MWMKTPNTILSNHDFVNGCGEFVETAGDGAFRRDYELLFSFIQRVAARHEASCGKRAQSAAVRPQVMVTPQSFSDISLQFRDDKLDRVVDGEECGWAGH